MHSIEERMDRRMASRRGFREGILAAAMAALLIFLLQAYGFQVIVVSSRSMTPTLRRGEVVLVDRLSYEFGSPQPGDLIVFHFPEAGDRSFLKRVIGVPGDTVAERDGRFLVNGSPLAWSGAHASAPGAAGALNMPPVRVPAGRYFVLGDNPSASLDSRFWGTVTQHEVMGKALVILWSQGAHWWDVRWNRIGRGLG
jgi:signal peptidase I